MEHAATLPCALFRASDINGNGTLASQPSRNAFSQARSVTSWTRAIGEVMMARPRARQFETRVPRVVQRCIIA